MYWIMFFDGSSKVVSDFELDEIIQNEDSRDSIIEIKDMDEDIILDTQQMIFNRLH